MIHFDGCCIGIGTHLLSRFVNEGKNKHGEIS